jgi:hypothetical protein
MLIPADAALTAEQYRQFRQELAIKDATKKDDATSTKGNIGNMKERWNRLGIIP